MMTTKLTTTLLGIAAGLAMITLPQTAQAQNSIAITGGTFDNSSSPGSISFTTSSQGTFSGNTTILTINNCVSGCWAEAHGAVSGSGFSPTGPVLFSNVPIVLQLPATYPVFSILSGSFNSTTIINGDISQAQLNNILFFGGISGPLTSPDFSVGQFHFTDPFPAPVTPTPVTPVTPTPVTPVTPTPVTPVTPVTPTFENLTASTQNFSIPEPISLQTGKGQAEAIFQAAQQQSLRPNGMHTRIIPAWTPGLYQ